MKISKSIKSLWSQFFKRHLFFANTMSYGVLLAIGDGVQQAIEFQQKVYISRSYDWKRTGKLFLVGLSQGPPHHYFYIWLDKVLPHKTGKTILKKILIDQFIAAPFFAFTFFGGCCLLERKSWEQFINEFKIKFPVVYAFDWFLWPPAQALNFYFVPLQYRVLYISAVTVIWDVFLSNIKHYDQVSEKQEDDS